MPARNEQPLANLCLSACTMTAVTTQQPPLTTLTSIMAQPTPGLLSGLVASEAQVIAGVVFVDGVKNQTPERAAA
jgi:hypothetical protein